MKIVLTGPKCSGKSSVGRILAREVDLNTPGFLSDYFREKVLAEAEVQYDAA